jgi:hypothetical protein
VVREGSGQANDIFHHDPNNDKNQHPTRLASHVMFILTPMHVIYGFTQDLRCIRISSGQDDVNAYNFERYFYFYRLLFLRFLLPVS